MGIREFILAFLLFGQPSTLVTGPDFVRAVGLDLRLSQVSKVRRTRE